MKGKFLWVNCREKCEGKFLGKMRVGVFIEGIQIGEFVGKFCVGEFVREIIALEQLA